MRAVFWQKNNINERQMKMTGIKCVYIGVEGNWGGLSSVYV